MGVTGILNTAKEALFAQQKAIQVVGQNIANVNTPGYSRERPTFLPNQTSVSGTSRFGVSVDQVTRAYDQFVTAQVNVAAANFHGTQTQADLLGQVETLLNDLSLEDAGLSGALERFFQDFQELARNPQGIPERTVLQQKGQSVVDTFHTLYGGLENVRQNLNTVVSDELEQINLLTTQIAELSSKIKQIEVDPKNNANTIRDERDQLVKELAEKVNISSFETDNGDLTVLLGGGRPLIEGVRANRLVAVPDANDPAQHTIQLEDGQGNRIDVNARITGGKLHGLVEVQDNIIPRFTTSLNRMAAQLVSSVNQIHSAGYGLDGTSGNPFFAPRQVSGQALTENTGGAGLTSVAVFDPTQLTLDDYSITFASTGPPATFDIANTTTGTTIATGQTYTSGAAIRFDGVEVVITDGATAPQAGDVFTLSTSKNAAQDIAIDAGILSDVKKIAAAQSPSGGDNTNALALANLRDTQVIDGVTLSEFYHTLVSDIGVESQTRTDLAESQQLLLTQLENRRESIAGVSLDEEQVDLIRFQQAFAAAANMIRVADELADTVVNLVR